MDTLYSVCGVHVMQRTLVPSPFIPIWMIMLWAIFASYIRTALGAKLKGRYITQFIAGLICGPLAWMAGNRMGAVTVSENLIYGYSVIALSWGVMCVILFKLCDLIRMEDE